MPFYNPTRPKTGDVFTADRLAAIDDELRRLAQIRGGAGLSVRHGRSGLQLAGVNQADKYVGIASTDFSPLSGSTPGSGTVEVYWLNPSTGDIEDTGIGLTAYCISSSTIDSSSYSIESGMHVTVWMDPFGTWWAEPQDCTV